VPGELPKGCFVDSRRVPPPRERALPGRLGRPRTISSCMKGLLRREHPSMVVGLRTGAVAGILLLTIVLFIPAGAVGWLRQRFPRLRRILP